MPKRLSSRVRRNIAQWYAERECNAAGAEMDAALMKRSKCRQRLYECECGQKLRAASDYLVAFHEHVDPDTLVSSFTPFIRQTPLLQAAPF